MEFQYLGTAAAEGIPAVFCSCERCVKSRKIGGRAVRTRTQAIIDGTLLIDFPADAYMHSLMWGIDYSTIRHCLVTHTHEDHLYPKEVGMMAPGFSHLPEDYHMTFYGSKKVKEMLEPVVSVPKLVPITDVKCLEPFETFMVDRYTVTALPAKHDARSGPLFYQISDGEKTILFAHDTHFFTDDIWMFWETNKPHFDMVSLDCTNAMLPLKYIGHMGLAENIEARRKMLEMGLADEKTKFVCNHFSHNGTDVVYDDFAPIASAAGFITSYDGMKITV